MVDHSGHREKPYERERKGEMEIQMRNPRVEREREYRICEGVWRGFCSAEPRTSCEKG